MKLAVDVAKAGLEVTIGYELNAMGEDTVRVALRGGTFDSILRGVPGQGVDEQRKNLYRTWKSELDLDVAFKRLDAQRKVRNSLLPYQKSDKASQERYLRTVRAFYETVNRRVTGKVDSYLAGTTRGGEVATGARDKLVQLLFADFVNGQNRELGQSLMSGLERDAAGSQTVLDEVDDYLFGLFSKSLDVAQDELAGTDPARPPESRWDLRFAASTTDMNATTREVTVTSAVQAIPPLNPTFEERNTTFELLMPEAQELQTQVVNGHVKLKLRHPRTQAILVEKDFRLGDVKPAPSDGLLVEREYWDAAKTILKREYQYVLEPGHVGGPARIRNGMERVYYQSGKLSYEATRKDNQLEGTMTRHWENGQTFDVATYKAGDREGPYIAFHPDGRKRAVGQFIHDRKVAPGRRTTATGKARARAPIPPRRTTTSRRAPGSPRKRFRPTTTLTRVSTTTGGPESGGGPTGTRTPPRSSSESTPGESSSRRRCPAQPSRSRATAPRGGREKAFSDVGVSSPAKPTLLKGLTPPASAGTIIRVGMREIGPPRGQGSGFDSRTTRA